jgi:hypothetical protein
MVGSVLARAQEVSGSISGTVMDATGASVSGAVVTLTNTDRAYVERSLKTDKIGYYTASSLPLGNYSVTIAMKGFKTATVSGLVLHANDALKLDRKLAVGSASDTVSVVANRAVLNLKNGMSEGLVSGTQVRELPLVTRNYEQLLTLQPGVSYGSDTNDQLYMGGSSPSGMGNLALFSINGLRPTANNWTIDGADNVNRGGASSISGANMTPLAYPSVDAISEFVTLRGTYEAEYGRSASGQINVVTKSGTNAFHGGAYEYFRNDVFNADNYFNKLTTPITPTPPLRYNDFGFTVGGPVVIPHYYNGRDKTFFFYSQEFRRVVQYQSLTSYVPTAAERTGDFTNAYLTNSSGQYTGGTGPVAVCYYPSSGACTAYTTTFAGNTGYISATSQAYVNSIYNSVPLPPSAADIAAGLDPHTLISNLRNIFHETQELVRVDHALNSKTNIFYRYTNDSIPTVEGAGLFPGSNPMPQIYSNGLAGVSETFTKSPGIQQVGHVTIAARPTLLVDMGYAYSLGKVVSTPIGSAASSFPTAIAPTLPYPVTAGVVPSLTFSGINGPNIASNGLYNDRSVNHNAFGSITKIKGQHTLKFGLTYNHYQSEETATGTNNQGSYTFTAAATPSSAQLAALGTGVVAPSPFDSQFANFLIGNAGGSPGFTQANQATVANINQNLIELYGQDDWRASRRLTVNLGVRYSYFGQPYDLGNELSNFSPAAYNKLNAETIASTGYLCTMAGQTTPSYSYTSTGVTVSYTLANCPNVNGLNPYQPNTIADPLDGIILGSPDFITAENAPGVASLSFPFKEPSGAPPIEDHGSPFGQEVGQAEKHDWAPRAGFAYDVFGNGKTVLRGGYGMAFDDSSVHQYEMEVFNNQPYVMTGIYPTAVLNPTFFSSGSASALVSGVPPSLYASPVIYKTPYVQQFSLDAQQAITPTMTLDVGYFGDHGTHLQGAVDVNEVQPGAFTQTSIGYNQVSGCSGFSSMLCELPLNQIRPYLGYTAINTMLNIFNSNYNSLQAKMTKKFSGKSLIDVNYTWSRSLTNAQNDSATAAQNTYNLAAEYGPSDYNRNQILTVDAVWELPWMKEQKDLMGRILGGWELSGIYAGSSGLPLTATMLAGGTVNYGGLTSTYNGQTNGGVVTDAAGLGILGPSLASLRPNQVLDPKNGYGKLNLKSYGPAGFWFNPTAFMAPSAASFQVGNERRGVVAGPGFNRFDVGIFRNFNLVHGVTFTLRGEGFNVLNHVNWGSVGTSATTSTFGRVTSTRDPRILQVAGKLNF